MKLQFGTEPKICRKCRIHHYENCDECLGFGFYVREGTETAGRIVTTMVTAAMAHDGLPIGATEKLCPNCGSGMRGVPVVTSSSPIGG